MRLILLACLLWSGAFAPVISTRAAEPTATAGVSLLLDDAAKAVAQGHYEAAASALERALRIQPQNAEIWHLLGQVRLHQGRYEEAEAMGEKSSALAGSNPALQERNAYLIRVARELRGTPAPPNPLAGTTQPRPAPEAPDTDSLPRNPVTPADTIPAIAAQTDRTAPDSRSRPEQLPEPVFHPPPGHPVSREQTVQLIYDPPEERVRSRHEPSIRVLDRPVPPAHTIAPQHRPLPADFLLIERLRQKLDRLRLDRARHRIEFRVSKPVQAKNNKHKKKYKKKHRKSQRRD